MADEANNINVKRGIIVQHKKISGEMEQNIFIVAVIVILTKALINFSDIINLPESLFSFFDIVFIGLMLVKMVKQSYSRRNIAIISIVGLSCAFTYSQVKYYYLLSSFFCIFASQNIDLRKLFKITSYIKFVFIGFHVICYTFAYFFMPSSIEYTVREGKLRHNFFMSHSNTFAMFLTWASLEYIYAKGRKLNNKGLLVLWLINLFSYFFTDSNTGVIIITIASILMLCDRWEIKKVFDGLVKIVKYGFFACTAFFAGITVIYSQLSGFSMRLFMVLDDFFTGRLLMGQMLYDITGWTLFGKYISIPETAPGKYFWNNYWFDSIECDNTYIWFFVSYGLIYLLYIGAGLYFVSNRATNVELICMLAYIFYAIMESYVINAVFCFPIFFIGKYLLNKPKTQILYNSQ